MRKSDHPLAGYPELLIFGVRSIGDVWHKLVWDIQQFEALVDRRPTDLVAIPFAYPNVCVTAVALRDWFFEECRLIAGRTGRTWSDSEGFEIVRARIRFSRLAEDVGNTFKHRGYRSTNFGEGVADLRVWFPPELQREHAKLSSWERALFSLEHQDVAKWTLLFRDNETGLEVDAREVFWAWEMDWFTLLRDTGMLLEGSSERR